MIQNVIIKSKRIIANNVVSSVIGICSVPDLSKIASFEEFKRLRISKVQWNFINTVGLTLNDGQYGRAGGWRDFNSSYSFDPKKKITQIEVFIHKYECMINSINFYHHQQRLVSVGTGKSVKTHEGRVEVFDIAEDEQLVGCELYYS